MMHVRVYLHREWMRMRMQRTGMQQIRLARSLAPPMLFATDANGLNGFFMSIALCISVRVRLSKGFNRKFIL